MKLCEVNEVLLSIRQEVTPLNPLYLVFLELVIYLVVNLRIQLIINVIDCFCVKVLNLVILRKLDKHHLLELRVLDVGNQLIGKRNILALVVLHTELGLDDDVVLRNTILLSHLMSHAVRLLT